MMTILTMMTYLYCERLEANETEVLDEGTDLSIERGEARGFLREDIIKI